MNYMLDTNMVSHLLRRHPGVKARMDASIHTPCLSALVAAELLYGMAKHYNAKRERAIVATLDAFTVLAWDHQAAQIYGPLRAQQERSGQPLAPVDLLIAAHAMACGCTLVTDDAAFARVDGLRVDNWLR